MRRWMMVVTAGAALAAAGGCALSAPGRASGGRAPISPQEQSRALGAMVDSAMKRNRIVGMSAVAVMDGERLLSEGYGWADRSGRIAVSPDSIFPIGSVTKLFTATAVMQLVERGMVDLDAPVSRYIPELAQSGPYADGPTVRQLLTHHGGLPGNRMEEFELLKPDPAAVRTLPRLLAGQPAACAPDTIFAYSNLGYGLLGCLVERMSGTSFADFVSRGILSPLGMSHTLFFQTVEDGARSVMGYDGRREMPIYPIRDIPAGALMSSAADMERFMGFIFDHGKDGVLARTAFEEMTRRQNDHVALDGEFSIGLGYWLIRPFPTDEPFASHGGDIPPFHALLVTMPEKRIGVFLAANSSGASSALIPLAVEMVRAMSTWQTGTPPAEPPLPPRAGVDPSNSNAWAGEYASPLGLIEVRSRAGRLLTNLQGLPLQLVPRSGGIFTPEVRLLGLVSIPLPQLRPLRFSFFESEGRAYLRITALGVLAGVGERFVPGETPAAWRARAGRYRIVPRTENTRYLWPRNISLGFEDGHGLLLSYEFAGLRGTFPLEALDERRAVIRGKGTGLGETIAAREEDGKVFLEWSGMLLERR